MLKNKNFKMGTSCKAQFKLTVRNVGVYIVKANVLMHGHFVYFIVLGVRNIINLTEIDCFSLVELILRTKIS